jgi:hypothetical protein
MHRVASAQPDDLGRAAADIKDDRIGHARIQQRRAARDHEARLLGGRDDLELDPHLVAHATEELAAIGGAAAGLGRHRARGADPALGDLAGADPERVERAVHCRRAQRAGRLQAFAQPDDPRERIDHAKPDA